MWARSVLFVSKKIKDEGGRGRKRKRQDRDCPFYIIPDEWFPSFFFFFPRRLTLLKHILLYLDLG